MNRIDLKFKQLKKQRKKAFIAFITAGDPNLKTTEDLVLAFERAGVDIVELGVPFSDPLADGPTIQASSQRALEQGVSIDEIFRAVIRIRKTSQIPIALMTYYNPVFHYGEDRFMCKAKRCGVDGVIIPDLPPEEARVLMKSGKSNGLAVVFFLAPTTTRERAKKVVEASSGFIYYVAVTGVTGAAQGFAGENASNIQNAKKMTQKPICVGFGVSTPAQVRLAANRADGVIVGSAIIRQIDKNRGQKDLVKNVMRFTHHLSKNLTSPRK